jgi:hypothetical protein
VLVLGQFAAGFYYPPAFVETADASEAIGRLQSELRRLDESVIWVNYGNCPAALTGKKIARAPGWVALEDIDRQQVSRSHRDQVLAPLRNRIIEEDRLHLLTNLPLEGIAFWSTLPVEWELVRDFEKELSGVRQVTIRWFGGGDYPRYLYRRRSTADDGGASTIP